jgi:hypothetical protein
MIAPAGSADINEVFNTQFVNSAYDLPFSAGTPEMNWQSSGYIRAWVDITGFRQMSRDNGIDYIPGLPADMAIIQYDTKAKVPGSVTKIDKSITTYSSNNLTIAVLKVDLYWKSISCDSNSCWEVPHHNKAQFQDSEVSPKIFIFPGNQSVTLKIYNGSVYKTQVLNFNLSLGITSINVTTNNGSLKQYFRAGQIAYTSKKVPYLKLIETEQFEQTGRDISKLNKEFVINSNLTSIEFFTPYGKLNASANITKILMPGTNVKSGVFGLIYIVLIFFGGLYVMFKSAF